MVPSFPLLSQAFLGLIFIKMTLTLMTSDCFCPHLQFYIIMFFCLLLGKDTRDIAESLHLSPLYAVLNFNFRIVSLKEPCLSFRI